MLGRRPDVSQGELSGDGRSLTVRVPLVFKRRGGRKQVVGPEGEGAWAPKPARVDSTLVKALARAHRWQAMLESGDYSTMQELAAAERINGSYLARVLRLTLLSPSVVEAIIEVASGSRKPHVRSGDADVRGRVGSAALRRVWP
jgi:hypothetical protein